LRDLRNFYFENFALFPCFNFLNFYLFIYLLASHTARAAVTVVTRLLVTCWSGSEEES